MEKNDLIILTSKETRLKVSSNIKGSTEYKKENIFDNNPETSWYSDQGKFQYIFIFFNEKVQINQIEITFDGGFSPKEIEVGVSENDEFNNKKPQLKNIKNFEIEDSNKSQILKFDNEIKNVMSIRLLMKKLNDLYGRVIVYELKILGKK